ncbi:MAG: ligase [Phycisphaerales bacterium]|jgi:RNA ligase|nr:ligase [Phycisphaerales bacterium]
MALDPQLLSQLQGPHPARRMPFDELRAGLADGVARKTINVSRDGDLELYGYSSFCQFEQQWDLFSLIARGLVLDVSAKRVVATPFPKFFNFNEGGVALPREPFEVSEKLDGSLGILFQHGGKWRVSTRGQLGSEQGQWATTHLHQNVATGNLNTGSTYLVEIVYPENRIVIPYDFSGLILLAAYGEDGHELPRHALEKAATSAGLRIAKHFASGSFDELLDVAQKLTRYEEGFVVRFAGGLRVKLKGEAYCRVHRLVCNCTPLALWEAMMGGEDLDAMRRELPEEMRVDFDAIRAILEAQLDDLVAQVRSAHVMHGSKSDKELGMLVQDPGSGLSEAQRKFLFACRKQDFLDTVRQPGEWRQKAFRHIRPDRNWLAGYESSNAMTRFQEEIG